MERSKKLLGLAALGAAGLAAAAYKTDRGREMKERLKDTANSDKFQHGFYESVGKLKAMGKSIEGIELIMNDGTHRAVAVDKLTKGEEQGLIGKSKTI